MDQTDIRYKAYRKILQEELVTAMGCTEPVAIAYAAARARETLGCQLDRVEIVASDNVIKNAKSAVVPNTGNLRGLEASAVAGIVAGDAEKALEVISIVDDEGKKRIRHFLESKEITVCNSQSNLAFDLIVIVSKGKSTASVQVSHFHTNIVHITKNGKTLYQSQDCDEIDTSSLTNRSIMNVRDLLDFAESVRL